MIEQNEVPTEKPAIFILNLDKDQNFEGLFDAIYPDMIESLTAKYHVQRARQRDAALRYLSSSENNPVAILIVDVGVTKKANASILDQVKAYITAGGTAVFMGTFSSFIRPRDMNSIWTQHWDLGWLMGDYLRTDVYLNSQKAVFLKNVASSDCIYLPSPESRTQSLVFSPEPVSQGQSPICLTKRGNGWLAYIGDVNNEADTQKVVMEIVRFTVCFAGASS